MNKKTEKFSFKSLIPMVLALLLIGLFIVPIPYYIEGPGTTENLKEFVTVDGKKDTQSGAFYLTTVGIRSATIFSAIKANFSDFQEVMSKKELMGDSSNSEYNRIQQYYMDSSKNAAIEQALKLAKVPYEMKFKGVYVLAMEDNSSFKGKIEVGDTVTGVDGKSFKSSEELMNYIKAQKVNQKVTVQFIQDGKAKEATGKLIELPTDKKAGIGIGLTDHQAHGEPGRAETWEHISVRQAIDHVWQWLRMPQQFPRLLLNSDVDRPLTLVLPPVLLEQVLANLILNAAQAGAKMLWIDAVRDAGGVKIVLQDNGGGIAGAQLAQAFQPFVTSRQEGMGLGLVICQRLVRYVRGEISLANQTAPDGRPGVTVVLTFMQQGARSGNGDNSSTG